MSSGRVAEQLADLVGPETFNKFLRSLPEAERKGRLFHWQEELIQRVRSQGLALPDTLPDLLALFSASSPLPIPVTRGEFLSDPLKYWSHRDYNLPATWLDDAAAQPRVREHLYYALARSASKVGDFGLAMDCLAILTRTLSPSEAAELYCYIRDTSQRMEDEWRPHFEAAFPDASPMLPAIRSRLNEFSNG